MTLRAFLIGLLLVVGFALITPYTDLYVQGSKLAFNHLPISALVALLLLVTVANGLLARVIPKRALTSRELALIYIMVLVASPFPSAGFVLYVIPVIAGVRYFASPENEYAHYFHERIPHWLTPTDSQAIKWLYEGLPAGRSIPWGAWLLPLGSWLLFALLLVGTFLCLGVLLRRQWIEHERLTFPLAQIPLEILGRSERPTLTSGIMSSRTFWIAFIAVALFDSVAGLHLYFPAIPELKLANIRPFEKMVVRPWTALNDISIFIYPAVIGVTFLLSQEVAASLWVFFWFSRLHKLVLYSMGFNEAGGPMGGYNTGTVLRCQEIGAFIVMAVVVLWSARRQIVGALRNLGPGPREEGGDPLSGRVALGGLVICLAGLVAWGTAAGMNPYFALAGILLFVVMALGLTRVVNQGGNLWVEANWLPYDVLNYSFGSTTLGAGTLTIMGMQQMVFMFDQRAITMPFLMDSMKIGHSLGIRGRHVALAVAAAIPTAMVAGLAAGLVTMYRYGGVQLDTWYTMDAAQWPYNNVLETLQSPMSISTFGLGTTAYGAAIMGLLVYMNKTYLWWRLSPLGYLFGSTWTMGHLWFSVMVGWALSVLARWAGGFKFYRAARPFFIGMVVGEFAISGLWLLIDTFAGVRFHVIFPAE